MWWPWHPPFCMVPGTFQPIEVRLIFNMRVQHALNRCRLPDAPDFTIAAGQQVGTLNGQAITTGVRLSVCDGLLMSSAAADARRAPAEALE